MTATRWTWLLCGVLYLAFFSWYTSLAGPLTDAEIEDYLGRLAAREPAPAPEALQRLRRFMEEDTGDDFVMLNLIDLYDVPQSIEGVAAGETSAEVLDKYMAYMYPALLSRACHPVAFGSAADSAMDLMNAPGMAQWTQGALMRYRSRRDLLEIASNPAFAGAHAFKTAAMAKTIAVPLDPWFHLGDPRLLLALLLALVACGLSWRYR